MINEKAFHLKIRKAKRNWDCPCCEPRDMQSYIKGKKKEERKLFSKLINEELQTMKEDGYVHS